MKRKFSSLRNWEHIILSGMKQRGSMLGQWGQIAHQIWNLALQDRCLAPTPTNNVKCSFHTGGDEVNANAYLLEESIRSNSTAILQPLVQKLVDFNHDKIRKAGLIPIVWEEMLLTWNLTLGSDVVVQTWLNAGSVQEVVARGHKALVGSYDFWVQHQDICAHRI